MKNVLRCIRCQATYPLALGAKWGRAGISDGYGQQPTCTNLLDAPGAPRAKDPETGEFTIVAQERCGGMLSTESVADNTPETDIEEYGREAAKGPLGARKRQAK